MRRKKKDQGDKALPASSAAQEQQNEDGTGVDDAYEYYVHYDEFNRRLDEWVQINKLDLSTLLRKDEKADGKKRWRESNRTTTRMMRLSYDDDAAAVAAFASLALVATTLGWLMWSGGWRGCVLSGGWCSSGSPSDGYKKGTGLPSGKEPLRRFLSIGLGLLSMSATLRMLWIPKEQKSRVHPTKAWRIASSGAVVCVAVCVVFPMSCGAFVDGERWVYLTTSDVVHDTSLVGCFLCVAAAVASTVA